VSPNFELDRVLAGWLTEGDDRLPADDLSAALGRVERTRQRHPLIARRGPHRAPGLTPLFSLVGVVAVLALTASLAGIRNGPPDLGSASYATLDLEWAAGASAPESVAFTALVPVGAPNDIYWRVATYDRFDLGAWSQTVDTATSVPVGEELLGGSAEDPADTLTMPIRATIRPVGFRDELLISPGTPVRVDVHATVQTLGADRWLAAVSLPAAPAGYTVDARILRLDEDGGVSPDRLRAAGSEYPSDVVDRYTSVPRGALGVASRQLLATVLTSTLSRDPHDLAVAVEEHLEDPQQFRYEAAPAPCGDASSVECFAQTRSGYCMHYASTMAILLRAALPENPIPTRIVQGFLPGERSGTLETVTSARAHAWVEVYFEGIGWVPFDPTPGGSATAP
jgi:hypothetical protein